MLWWTRRASLLLRVKKEKSSPTFHNDFGHAATQIVYSLQEKRQGGGGEELHWMSQTTTIRAGFFLEWLSLAFTQSQTTY